MASVHAPELPQTAVWLNTDRPLSLKELRGRIVLLDFWTYGCINCLHVLPDLHSLEQRYKTCLTVIGVHTAKFENEQAVDSIRQAILRYHITHPVIVDSDLQVWQQYVIKAWPTVVVIDPEGYVVDSAVGEGKRKLLEARIESLIQAHRDKGTLRLQELTHLVEQNQIPRTPLYFPGKVLADQPNNRLFIADTGHHRLVITALNGEVKFLLGNGEPGLWDGDFDEVQFSSPQGMALDAENGLLYVADTGNHVIRLVNLNECTVETIAGIGQQSQILHPHGGDAREVALNSPWDVEKFRHFLLIAMAGSHQIWGMDLQTEVITSFMGTGAEACVDGVPETATFAQPSGLAHDGKELFVADSETSTIRAVELDNTPQVRTICGSGDLTGFGDRDGQGEAVRLQHCMAVEYGGNHLVWIADTYNHKIKQVNTQTGICQTLVGNGYPELHDGQGLSASFYEPSGLSLSGNWLYVADTNNHAIRRINPKTLEVRTLHLLGLSAPDS